MEIYQWIMRQNEFYVSDTAYFVYVNGDQHFEDGMLKSLQICFENLSPIPYM